MRKQSRKIIHKKRNKCKSCGYSIFTHGSLESRKANTIIREVKKFYRDRRHHAKNNCEKLEIIPLTNEGEE